MTAGKPCVVVLGGSSSLHARIPAQMVRDAGYRVVLANTEAKLAPGTADYFDAIHSVVTAPERAIGALRRAVVKPAPERPIQAPEIVVPTRWRSFCTRLALGWLRGRRLVEVVGRERPGLVHVQGFDVGGMATYYYLRRKGLATRVGRPGTLVHLFSYSPRFAGIRRREIRALAAADQLHTSSPVVARIYREHYAVPAEKIHLLVRGIDFKTFARRDPATLDAARARWGVPAGKFVLIHNRHLHPMYRVDLAVDTFIELVRRGHDVFLVLVRGSMCKADYEARLVNHITQHGLRDRVTLMPPILSADEMALALQLSDCSINTVPADAFPVSILESMYCHAVPVVRNLESYDLFVRDGGTGFLCGGTGIEQYVEKVERLIRDPQLKQRLAHAGASLVAAQGSVEVYRRRLLELVQRCWREW
jgi:glycosyltransferase involved in cell wall biosynthesis